MRTVGEAMGQSVHGGHRAVKKPSVSVLISCQLNRELCLRVLPRLLQIYHYVRGISFNFRKRKHGSGLT